MPDAHKNFAYSTVATAPSPADTGTSLVVQAGDGAKFPTPPFNATVWPYGDIAQTTNAEIVRVTAISGDTLTITRTQEGTSARLIGISDQIAATITAKTLTDIESARPTLQLAVIAASGSVLVPAGVTSILAEAWGGGGAGGGSGSATGSGTGGGSGSYSRRAIPTVPGETLTVTIGAGGVGAANAAGGNGGNTLLQRGATTLLQANGGSGGAGATGIAPGGAGGTPGTGDYTVPGQQGGPTAVNGGGNAPVGGSGGATATFPIPGTSTAGNPGATPGGGASGSSTVGAGPNVAGGNGAPGLIAITYLGSS
jgi:hypothetical protein